MNKIFDLVIIGAGIVGLSTARALKVARPDLNICLIDKEKGICHHQSGHNSGVIHSGIYYKPGSLKARLCTEGARLLFNFCHEKDIPYRKTGKLIVAVEENELEPLEQLYQRGLKNGLEGLELLGPEQIREREPHLHGLKAIVVPATAIIDFKLVAGQYYQDLNQSDCLFKFNFKVHRIKKNKDELLITSTNGENLLARHLVSCCGLYSDHVSRLTGGKKTPKIVPFRGDYLLLDQSKHHLIKGNIYPVPNPAFPFLGVHFTPRMNGELWLGPNAVLAFAREGYRFQSFNARELFESLTYPGFIKLAGKYFSEGMSEMWRDLSKKAFVRQLQKYIPEIQPSDCLPGPSGVRAQALELDGSLVDDFVFDESDERMIHVRNAPSPAATSSIAIGRWIADKCMHKFFDSTLSRT